MSVSKDPFEQQVGRGHSFPDYVLPEMVTAEINQANDSLDDLWPEIRRLGEVCASSWPDSFHEHDYGEGMHRVVTARQTDPVFPDIIRIIHNHRQHDVVSLAHYVDIDDYVVSEAFTFVGRRRSTYCIDPKTSTNMTTIGTGPIILREGFPVRALVQHPSVQYARPVAESMAQPSLGLLELLDSGDNAAYLSALVLGLGEDTLVESPPANFDFE